MATKKVVKQGKNIRILAEMITSKGFKNSSAFAKSAKWDLAVVRCWINGKYTPTDESFERLKTALNCTPDEVALLEKWRNALKRAIKQNSGKKKTGRSSPKMKPVKIPVPKTSSGVVTEEDINSLILPIMRRRKSLSQEDFGSLIKIAFGS